MEDLTWDMRELLAFALQELDEDEQVAREASRRDADGFTPTGEHWHWVEPKHDQVLTLDPMLDEYLNDGGRAALRSVEEYPTSMSYTLPHFVISGAEETRTVDAMHIACWDPARVLALTRALREAIDGYMSEGREAEIFIAIATALYSGRPGWRAEWHV